MSEVRINELHELAAVAARVSELLKRVDANALPPIAREHLSVAQSSMGQAKQQLELTILALTPAGPSGDFEDPDPPSVQTSTPPRRD